MSDRRPKIPTALVREVQSRGKCAYCGVPHERDTVDGRGLHDIHHVDGNSSNNEIENLIYLCSKPYNNCHLIKGHLGNSKKINNNLLKEIKMKDTLHILRALHFAVRRGEFGATPWDRINLPLNRDNYTPIEFSSPVKTYIDGETQEFVDSKPIIDLFIEVVRDTELTPTQIYEKYTNPLVDFNNKYPIKNDLGEDVDKIYGEKNSSDNRMYRKITDARRIREREAKSSVGQEGNKTQSSSSDASLYIPPQLTGSLLDSVNENPDRARAAKLIFDQYAA
jgi:hypothetical protein